MSPRWYDKRTRRLPRARHRRRRARAAVGDGARQQGPHAVRQRHRQRACRSTCRRRRTRRSRRSSGRSRSGRTRSSATARGSTSSPTRRAWRCTSSTRALDGGARGQHEGVRGLRRPRRGDRLRLPRGGARRALAPPGDPRRQDRQLPPVPADAVERQPDRLLRDARALRGRGDGAADLRGERPGRLPRHRHHARGAQLRPVPAVRRAHVPRARARRCGRCTRRCSASTGSGRAMERAAARSGRAGREPAGGARGASPTRPRARGRPSSCRRCSSSTARGSRGSSTRRRARRTARWRPRWRTTSWSSHLLLLHGLHPVPVEERVRGALDEVRPYLESHGGERRAARRRGRAWCGCGCRAAAAAARRRR